MDGIYIPDMKMPKEGFVEILIRDNGTVQQTGQSYRVDGTDYYTPYVGEMPVMYKAVPVPSHGRLIDADAFEEENAYFWNRDFINPKYSDTLADLVNDAPTIIPAEEGET